MKDTSSFNFCVVWQKLTKLKCITAIGLEDEHSPLQSFPNIFDLLILLGQDFLHVAIGRSLLELLLQLLQTTNKQMTLTIEKLNASTVSLTQQLLGSWM